MPACVTPGSARTRSSSRSKNTSDCGVTRFMSAGVLSKYFVPPSRMSAVSRPSVSKPGRSRCSRRNPRSMRPAPTSSTIESETSTTSSAARPRRRPPPAPADASLNTSLRSRREARSAGIKPNTRLDATEIGQREAEHAPVDRQVAQQTREVRGHDEREEPHAPERERDARRRRPRATAADSR